MQSLEGYDDLCAAWLSQLKPRWSGHCEIVRDMPRSRRSPSPLAELLFAMPTLETLTTGTDHIMGAARVQAT